jgi:hypothetical protein
MYTNKPPYVSATGKPQEVSHTTYGGSTGNVEAAQQAAASKVSSAAAGSGGTKPVTPVKSGAATKVIPQNIKASGIRDQQAQTVSQGTSASIQKDAAAVAAKAGRR